MKYSIKIFLVLLIITGCSPEPELPEPPKLIKPSPINYQEFCSLGISYSEISADLAKSLAADYLNRNKLIASYQLQFARGLINGQLAISNQNVQNSMTSFIGGYGGKMLDNNSGSGIFMSACVNGIIEGIKMFKE